MGSSRNGTSKRDSMCRLGTSSTMPSSVGDRPRASPPAKEPMASVRADQLEVCVRCRVRREPVVPSSAVAKKLAELLCELAIGPQQAPQDKRFAAVETAAEDAAALQPLPFREDQALGRTAQVAVVE